MKKNKKKIIIGGLVLAVLVAVVIVVLNILSDKNKLTVSERKWLNNNSGTVQNIKVANDINIFAKDGVGVFFDFIDDFGKNYGLNVNPITYDYEKEQPSSIAFKISTNLDLTDLLIYQDHFVVVAKKEENFKSHSDFSGKKIGVLNKYLSYVSAYLSNINNVNFVQYEDVETLLKAFDEEKDINYILVPQNEYMDKILTSNYSIAYHLSDIPVYYSLQTDMQNLKDLSSILKKYYNTWIVDEFNESYDKANLNLFIESLEIARKDQDFITSKVYNYGFVGNSPYEVIMSGTYGGIISSYLKKFSDFSNVEFKFIKYKKISDLSAAINRRNIDIYFSTNDLTNDYKSVPSLMNITYNVIAHKKNYRTVNSLKSLTDAKVYVLEGSLLASYLMSQNLDVRTYSTIKEAAKITDDDSLIVIDNKIYDYYSKNELKNHTVRYRETLAKTYNFKTSVDDAFFKLFSKYINSLDPTVMSNIGIYNHDITVKNGTIISKLASYVLYIVAFALVAGFIIYKSTKKIKLATKIKKEDKMRFIDQLTSLKNRNYLSENIENWNKNTIYPQATIIMDLNNIQEINDTLGYDQGDAQIKAAANVLIKTQLDNSDIIRTDGNEFLIYLVGYQEKQIVSYIRKLYKELKNMPFDYGAALGYSMIIDDLKTIEDAINEAVEDMRIKKSESYEE